jgi:hypothetical protein
VDSLAKKALKAAHSTGKFIDSSFPNEQLWITMGGKKVTGSLRNELEDFWGHSTAKKFFHKKGIVPSAHFDSACFGWVMNGLFLDTLKPSTHSSQNRYLDGAAVPPSSCCVGRDRHQQLSPVRM